MSQLEIAQMELSQLLSILLGLHLLMFFHCWPGLQDPSKGIIKGIRQIDLCLMVAQSDDQGQKHQKLPIKAFQLLLVYRGLGIYDVKSSKHVLLCKLHYRGERGRKGRECKRQSQAHRNFDIIIT